MTRSKQRALGIGPRRVTAIMQGVSAGGRRLFLHVYGHFGARGSRYTANDLHFGTQTPRCDSYIKFDG